MWLNSNKLVSCKLYEKHTIEPRKLGAISAKDRGIPRKPVSKYQIAVAH
jgi:hypothetical protein